MGTRKLRNSGNIVKETGGTGIIIIKKRVQVTTEKFGIKESREHAGSE